MKEKKIRKFKNDYETKVKKARDAYYQKLQSKEYKYLTRKVNYNAISILVTFIICVILFISFKNIIADILVIVLAFIATAITRYIIKEDDNLQNNDYTRTIRKLGYYSVEEYEEKLTEYLTGTCGIYHQELEDLKKTHNITKDTPILIAQNNDRYFAWTNTGKTLLYLLNTKISEKPEVKTYNLDYIRYYRLDKTQRIIIIKTDAEDLYFNESSLEEVKDLLPGKEFHEVKTFEPEKYIDDFELYIHKVKIDLEKKEAGCNKKKAVARNYALATFAIMITGSLLSTFTNNYVDIIFDILSIILLWPFIIKTNQFFREYFRIPKNDYEVLRYLNDNREIINHFHELKVSLAIDSTSDVVYTHEGAQYLTWTKNGYFHVFMNMIYFNVVYMAIKTNDVEYYKADKHECIIKLKDKTLTFKPEAEEVFKRILPNKDYKWLNKLQ